MELIRQLIKDLIDDNNSLKRIIHSNDNKQLEQDLGHSAKKIRVLDSYKLLLCRLVGNHYVKYRNKREACLWCHFQQKKGGEITLQNPPQSNFWCNECNVPLCCNKNRQTCFKEFHTFKE